MIINPITKPIDDSKSLVLLAKNRLNINKDCNDDGLMSLVRSAYSYVENYTQVCLFFNKFLCKIPVTDKHIDIRVPITPIYCMFNIWGYSDFACEKRQNIHSIKTVHDDKILRIKGKTTAHWITVEFLAGYGNNVEDIPSDLLEAVLIKADSLYNKNCIGIDKLYSILDNYRIRNM